MTPLTLRYVVEASAIIQTPVLARAEEAALDAIGRGQSVLLLGQPGTGKSLLLARLGAALREQGAGPHELRRDDRLHMPPTADTLLIDEAGLA